MEQRRQEIRRKEEADQQGCSCVTKYVSRTENNTETEVCSVLEPGRNCWKTAQAERLGLLLEGEAYFRAFREAILAAEKQAVIIGWDFNTRIDLVRDEEPEDGHPVQMGPFLESVLEAKPDLHLYVLIWDYSFVYAMEREWQAFSETLRDPHPRFHFVSDAKLPNTSSHHQKVVLVDDEFAFLGGIDLSVWRWDTPDHELGDERRRDPKGKIFEPYHDAQFATTGEASGVVRELCAYRWNRATGDELPPAERESALDFWPSTVTCETRDVEVGISRTFAAWEGHPEVFENEALHVDIIEKASDYLYFENQYFSSNRLAQALLKRLREPDCPEVLIVLNDDTEGWLEEMTMGVTRDHLFELLSKADENDRVRFLYPVVYDKKGKPTRVYVHAKVIIADDCLVKVGSSNLSNRSMRVDSEADLTCADAGSDGFAEKVRDTLLGSHLGVAPEEFRTAVEETGSLCGAVDRLMNEEGKSLATIRYGVDSGIAKRLADSQLLDPDEPLDPRTWINHRISEEERPSLKRRILTITSIIAVGLLLVGLLKWGWGEVIDKEKATAFLEDVKEMPYAPLVLLAVFVVSGISGISLNLILVAATVVFGPWTAFLCGYFGGHVSALLGFGAGRTFGKPLVRKIGSRSLGHLDEHLKRRGVLSVAVIRLLPVAPFVVVNVAAGASKLNFQSFNWGTLAGMFPGMLAVVVLTHQIDQAVTDPGWKNFGYLAAAIVVTGLVFAALWKTLGSRRKGARASA
ncbi:MAG: hypothetical protein CMO55_09210 [Verrucomicrobiales bacterium]|nr:hypothetical protein [Verrucomicrobiales bacterium]